MLASLRRWRHVASSRARIRAAAIGISAPRALPLARLRTGHTWHLIALSHISGRSCKRRAFALAAYVRHIAGDDAGRCNLGECQSFIFSINNKHSYMPGIAYAGATALLSSGARRLSLHTDTQAPGTQACRFVERYGIALSPHAHTTHTPAPRFSHPACRAPHACATALTAATTAGIRAGWVTILGTSGKNSASSRLRRTRTARPLLRTTPLLI